ncbi:hypothetical protein PHISCL_11277 [Aspergillus sclerotialis]|uniref:Uncharacterized protein n=1 Tax=Aspergillus sclerotialis TaxID=2070753 RepID=A0A3A2Z0G8_9EURO|nr:hypothetical protein PHISCL_11277 [Aspergillus sclerotialis]
MELLPGEEEVLMMIDLRCLGVLHPDPVRLGRAMVPVIPVELGVEQQADTQDIPVQRSDLRLHAECWEIVDQL